LERARHIISVFSVRSESRKKPAKSTQEATTCLQQILAWLTLQVSRRGQYVPPKYQALSELYSIATQKTVLFIAVYLFFFYTPLWA
jgi:hypothetical protein